MSEILNNFKITDILIKVSDAKDFKYGKISELCGINSYFEEKKRKKLGGGTFSNNILP